MSSIPYEIDNSLSINVAFKCDKLGCYIAFMSCPLCKHYPCSQLTNQDLLMLSTSPLMNHEFKSLISRRIKKMYIAKKKDGNLELIEKLDEKNPDPEQLKDVEEIYVIGKVLVPVMTLKPKPKEDHDEIIDEIKAEKAKIIENVKKNTKNNSNKKNN